MTITCEQCVKNDPWTPLNITANNLSDRNMHLDPTHGWTTPESLSQYNHQHDMSMRWLDVAWPDWQHKTIQGDEVRPAFMPFFMNSWLTIIYVLGNVVWEVMGVQNSEVNFRPMTWHEMVWHEMARHEMAWHKMAWHEMKTTWHEIGNNMTWHDMELLHAWVEAELTANEWKKWSHEIMMSCPPHTSCHVISCYDMPVYVSCTTHHLHGMIWCKNCSQKPHGADYYTIGPNADIICVYTI